MGAFIEEIRVMKSTPGCPYLLVLLLLFLIVGCSPYGSWDLLGQIADGGLRIISVTADDPDDLDSVFGNGDTLTVLFRENTNQVVVSTKVDIDAVFSFNQSPGADYTGAWSAPDTLVITVVDSTGSAPPTIGGLVLTFQPGNGVKNAAATSVDSTGSSPAATGNWGSRAGPTITSAAADDPDDADAVYGDEDSITVTFSEDTNQVAVATKGAIDTIFSFNQSLGTDYTGAWLAADTLVITVVDSTGAEPPTVAGLVLTFQPGNGVKNAAGTSTDSTGNSPSLSGDWGNPVAGPTITSVVADDPDDADAVYGDGDTITVAFSENTNQIAAATKANLDAIFISNQSLGADYTGSWSTADTLVITVADSTGATPPTVGGLVLTFQAGNGVKNAAGTSADSVGFSPTITGDWGEGIMVLSRDEIIDPANWNTVESHIAEQIALGTSGPPTWDTATISGLPGNNDWFGSVLADNGKIYCIPWDADNVLIIDPATDTVDTTSITGLGIGGEKWIGGVLAPNGKIYGIPAYSSSVLIIDPMTDTTVTFGSLAGAGDKWMGGVLAPNGLIYGIPGDATSVLVIDPVADSTFTFGSLSGDGDKWYGGVLAPNGKIYCMPREADDVLVIDPQTNTLDTIAVGVSGPVKWVGGVLAPNGKIYGIPRASDSVLIIDPATNTVDTDSIDGLGVGGEKWNGGVLAPNGKIYGVPRDADNVLIIDPMTNNADTTTISGLPGGSAKWFGANVAQNGLIYCTPRDSTSVLIIDPKANGTFDPDLLLSGYLNGF